MKQKPLRQYLGNVSIIKVVLKFWFGHAPKTYFFGQNVVYFGQIYNKTHWHQNSGLERKISVHRPIWPKWLLGNGQCSHWALIRNDGQCHSLTLNHSHQKHDLIFSLYKLSKILTACNRYHSYRQLVTAVKTVDSFQQLSNLPAAGKSCQRRRHLWQLFVSRSRIELSLGS